MFTAPPASPIPTSCAEFLRKRYPSLLLYLPIDAPKTINKNKKSKTYIRMGRAQYRERRVGQKKEKSGRTGRAAIRRRKEEGERKVLAAGGQQRDEQKKRKSQNATPTAARGQHEQKRRERAAEKAAKSGRGRERRKAPPRGAAERQRGTGEERAIAAPKARKTEILTTNEDGTEGDGGLPCGKHYFNSWVSGCRGGAVGGIIRGSAR